jgi:hypothetical protein
MRSAPDGTNGIGARMTYGKSDVGLWNAAAARR